MFPHSLRMLSGVRKCSLDVHKIISRCFQDVLTHRMFSDILYILSEKKTAKKTNDPKGTLIGRMDFDNQKVFSDTSVLVLFCKEPGQLD